MFNQGGCTRIELRIKICHVRNRIKLAIIEFYKYMWYENKGNEIYPISSINCLNCFTFRILYISSIICINRLIDHNSQNIQKNIDTYLHEFLISTIADSFSLLIFFFLLSDDCLGHHFPSWTARAGGSVGASLYTNTRTIPR